MWKTLLLMGLAFALLPVFGCHKSGSDDGTPTYNTPPPKTGKPGAHGTPSMTGMGKPPPGAQTPGK